MLMFLYEIFITVATILEEVVKAADMVTLEKLLELTISIFMALLALFAVVSGMFVWRNDKQTEELISHYREKLKRRKREIIEEKKLSDIVGANKGSDEKSSGKIDKGK